MDCRAISSNSLTSASRDLADPGTRRTKKMLACEFHEYGFGSVPLSRVGSTILQGPSSK